MPAGSQARFNLVDDPWIPVVWHDGRYDRLGIGDALAGACRIRQLAAASPLDNFAVFRLLLAVLYWCRPDLASPSATATLDPTTVFVPGSFAKLTAQRSLFDLFGGGSRFYQDPACRQKQPRHTANYLIHELPTGTSLWHFRHLRDLGDGVCPACCALGLVRLPVFATQGGQGKSPGINGRPPWYVAPVGNTLAQTLLLSCQLISSASPMTLGSPEWEAPGQVLPSKGPVPLLAGLTCIPRRVWLADPEEPPSACAYCGRHTPLVRRCVFDGKGGRRLDAHQWRDPHVMYDQQEKPLCPSNPLDAPDADAGRWSGRLAALLRRPSPSERLWLIVFATEQNKYYDTAECFIPLPSFSAAGPVPLAESLEAWHKKGRAKLERGVFDVLEDRWLGTRRQQEKGTRRLEVSDSARAAAAVIRPGAEKALEASLIAAQTASQPLHQAVAQAYRPFLKMLAESFVPGVDTTACSRRQAMQQAAARLFPKVARRSARQ